ncbi:MAG: hypothetical protein HYZ13_14100 [Acidobacteria bacterium]|nr:hypothetical protein [Acidobacteriota bacterium]
MQAIAQVLNHEFIEFDLKYKKDGDDPKRIFRSMVSLLEAVETTGKLFLKGVDPDLTFKLGVEETKAGSLITRIFGKITKKNGEELPKETEEALAKGIAEAGKAVLRSQQKVDKQGRVNEKELAEHLGALQKDVAQDYAKRTGQDVPILIKKPISEKHVQSIMGSLATGAFALEAGDQMKITVAEEPFDLNPELRPSTEVATVQMVATQEVHIEKGDGPKLIRVTTPRYGSPKGWEIIHNDKPYKAEILHSAWFERIKEQLEEVGPKDQLLVEAEFEMRTTPGGRSSGVCKVHRVISTKKYHPSQPPELGLHEDHQ